ncbi:TIGR04197 family type VII secretion effector [Staphylococcus epidermidis]|uniref:TIGR04197 family type VII secretion effector n=1 Tax=Staphylococcus epidermidis TaxID=1282 RepID=UPI00029917E8|nr:TIGR04197 family type VII secretion effector [Staphylococcus epidermidis]EKS26395.1 hypothetical protein HMPREF9281_02341 [Staphylococcus epidermidis BVS058A4]
MGKIKSDSSQTNQIFSSLQSAIEQCESVSEPSKDNNTTVKGNTNAHNAMDDLIKMNQSVAEVIEKASKNIQNVGESFEQIDQSIGNDIAKN